MRRRGRRQLAAFAGAIATIAAGLTVPARATGPTFAGGVFPGAPASGLAENAGAEPAIASAPDGTLWATSNAFDARGSGGLRANDVWRSVDGGRTFRWVASPFNPRSDGPGFGGDDVDIAVAPRRNATGHYNVYVAGLWIAADVPPGVAVGDISLAISRDNGRHWIVDYLAAGFPGDDRPWLAADGPCTVYLTYHAGPTLANTVDVYDLCSPVNTVVGQTLTPVASTRYPQLAIPAATGGRAMYVTAGFNKPAVPRPGHVVIPMMDCPNLTLIQELQRAQHGDSDCPPGVKAEVVALVSADGGRSWQLRHVARASGRRVAVWPVTAAADAAGTVYLAWHDDRHVSLAVSHDGGTSWTERGGFVDVSPSETSVYPVLAGGERGVVEIAWYGADRAGDAQDPTVMGAPGSAGGAQWRVFWARSVDEGTTFTQVAASDVVHRGFVCTQGVACTVPGSRNLLDDFGLTINPRTGRATMAFTSDQPAPNWRHAAFATQQ